MYKKIFSAILLGAMTLASTSTFVSCKDYDDDIQDLQEQITANDKDNQALHEALTAAENNLSSLKAQLEQKEAELKVLIATAQNAADAAQAAADAAQKNLDIAKEQLSKAITDGDAATLAAAIKAVDEAKAALTKAIATGDAETLAAAKAALAEAVEALNKAIAEGDAKTLEAAKAAIESAKALLETAIKAGDEATLASAKKYTDEEVAKALDKALAAVSKLEVRVKANEDAIVKINGLIKDLQDNKVDKTTFEKAVADIYTDLEAIEKDLGDALKRIDTLEKGLADEVKAREALKKDFEEQVKVIENHTKKLAELEKTMATKAELAAEIKKVREDYAADLAALKTELQKQIKELEEALTEDIEALEDRATAIEEDIEEINDELSALNVLILRSLRSLVFIPDFYYWGIEATELSGVYVNYWNFSDMPVVSADKSDATWSYGKNVLCYDPAAYKSAKLKTDFIVEQFQARYHLNPSTADLTNAKINILQGDREFRTKAATDAKNTNIAVASFDPATDVKGGDLYLNLDILDPSKVKNIGHIEEGEAGEQRHFVQDEDETGLVTVFAAEVELNDANKNTVTSDYAALRATTYANGYRLAHTLVGDPDVKAPIAGATGSYTKVENLTDCGTWGKDARHLFTDADETVYGAVQKEVVELVDQPRCSALGEAASTTTAQDVVVWNSTINLSKLAEVHRLGNLGTESTMTAKQLKENGFEIRFELTGLLMSQNATSETAHAAIQVDEKGNYILRPQLPKFTDEGAQSGQSKGYAAEYGATNQDRTTIGRTPLVRVLLVDTKNDDRILDYGYIRLVIIDTPEVIIDPTRNILEYVTGKSFTYKYYDCGEMPAATGWDWTQTWASFENDLYNMYHLPQVEFETNYDSVLVAEDFPRETKYAHRTTANTLAQYMVKIVKNGEKIDTIFTECTQDQYLGEIFVKEGENIGAGTKTQVITWNVKGDELKQYALDGQKVTTRAIKYEVVTEDRKYAPIYVILKAGDVIVEKMKTPTPTVTGNFDLNKIKEYWYDENTQKTSNTLFEAHLNVPSPEDGIATWLPVKEDAELTKPFEFLLSSDFDNNKILDEAKLDKYITVLDPTNGMYALSKAEKSFGFVVDDAHKTFKGYSGKVYTMSVADYQQNPTWGLYATTGGVKELVAYLEYDETGEQNINHIKIVLNKDAHRDNHTNSFVEDLLNYKAHNALADDFLKVLLGVSLKWECYETVVPAFQVRFLRPINMFSEDHQVQDAANTTQVISLYDLVRFTDWREQWNPTAASTINKARRAEDYVQDGNKWIVDYYYYYNVKHILVGDPTTGIMDPEAEGQINDRMKTNMNGNDINTTALVDVTKNVEFSYIPASDPEAKIGEPGYYGSIKYTNNRSTVDDFKVTVPVTVCYEWGHIYMPITIDIRKTLENTTVKVQR